ncbi:hypothetical protein [Rhizobium sp. BE258]|jgi:hypothetical protein|uniref:hypothetical protein n=1 Tax=unclassified Rhizobium TaxID=2613769 RepID=UPI000DD5A659|nr:hypothetical protein [Rhizobium sp. BE258]MDR7145838.1 hypothetical protein [Rhizobium sp. BE258]
MFFLGGMTMGYLEPPVKAERSEQPVVSIPAEKDRRFIDVSAAAQREENAIERSLIWAWRTLC